VRPRCLPAPGGLGWEDPAPCDSYDKIMKSVRSGHPWTAVPSPCSYLPGLSYERQKREICGMQDVMKKRFGRRPSPFRPPYGNYNEDTLRAAKSCGVKWAPLWDEEVFVDHWEYREWDRSLHPGDIVLTHFRGKEDWKRTMPDMVRRFMKKVTDEGYAVARLEDCL